MGAHLHASFWKLPHVVGLKTPEEWLSLLFNCWTAKQREVGYSLFGPEFSAEINRICEDIGFAKLFEHLNSHATTLCQGDAHNGQVLRMKKHSSYAQEHGRTVLIDFGCAIVANPVFDIGSFIVGVEIKNDEEYIQCL